MAFLSIDTAALAVLPVPKTPDQAQGSEIDLDNADPEMSMQRDLVELMFTGKDRADPPVRAITDPAAASQDTAEPETRPSDTVTISRAAMELNRKDTVDIAATDENGTIRIHLEHEERLRVEAQTQQQPASADPLVVDLDSDGIELTDARKGYGVRFDLTADGTPENVSWVSPHDGLLAYDRNSDGCINDGRELFGDANGASDGFAELRKYDSDGNNRIDRNDPIFEKLQIWQDENGDGVSDVNELKSLDAYGIQTIDLVAHQAGSTIAGNTIAGISAYHTSSASAQIGEVYLNFLA